MAAFVVRRLQTTIPVIVLVSVITFGLILLLPGDAAMMMLGEQSATDRETYARLRQELGLDQPLPLRYLNWASRTVQGDFGRSLRDGLPVAYEVQLHVLPTLELAALAMLLALTISVPAGVISALKPNSVADNLVTFLALSGVAVPHFFFGILLIYLLSLWLQILPPSGYVEPWIDPGENLKLMLMPAVALSTGLAAVLMRQLRSTLIEVIQQDYIVTARAKGLAERTVIFSHAMKNALLPIATVVGLQLGTLIGGTVVVETVFSIPGMGRLIVDSILFRDFPTVQAVVLILALSVVAANFLTDVFYAYVDPRIRFG